MPIRWPPPSNGWYTTRNGQKRWERKARHSYRLSLTYRSWHAPTNPSITNCSLVQGHRNVKRHSSSPTPVTSRHLSTVLGRFSRVRVLVIGDLMLDRYIWGQVERISPEAPVPVVRVTRESLHAGGAGNVAANIRSLGG